MVGWGKQAILQLNVSISRKLQEIRPKLLFMTNRKLHMRFRLTPISMTLDDSELYSLNLQRISQDFGCNNSQMNEDRPVLSATTL